MFGDWDGDGRLGVSDVAKTAAVFGMLEDGDEVDEEAELAALRAQQRRSQGADRSGCLRATLWAVGFFVALLAICWLIEVIAG